MIIDTALSLQEHRLRSTLAAGLRRAQRTNRPTLVSIVQRAPLCDPLVVFERGAGLAGERMFWSSPREEYVIAGVDAAWALTLEGSDRFAAAAAAWRDLCADALIDDPFGVLGTGPVLMGGFSFDPLRPATSLWEGYPDGLLVLPRFVLTRIDDTAWLTINIVVWPDSALDDETEAALRVYDLFDGESVELTPARSSQIIAAGDVMPADRWKTIVGQIERDLRRGDLGKVVLAR